MADKTKISWTEATWNPIIGCSRVSEGCRHCYAETQAKRIALMQPGSRYAEVLRVDPKGGFLPMWNGKAVTMPDRLDQPIRWNKPRRIFVNSMSDLFHDDVSNEYIAAVFGVMAAAQHHTFQVLTKRPERMKAFFAWVEDRYRGSARPWKSTLVREHARKLLGAFPEDPRHGDVWPLPNVWLGVSAEDQFNFDRRWPLLIQCPAAVRWVSMEPMLGPVDVSEALRARHPVCYLCHRSPGQLECETRYDENIIPRCNACGAAFTGGEKSPIDWIVIGGESGSEARGFDAAWARAVIRECHRSDVAAYMKQTGPGKTSARERNIRRVHDSEATDAARWFPVKHHAGAEVSEWPEDLRVQDYPEAAE